jgi:hypothetical protein
VEQEVEPTNNARERALRHAVIWRKLSFGTQSAGGIPTLPTMRWVTLRVILRMGLGLAPGTEMDRLEQKMERFLSHGRQRYALVLMTIIPIQRLSGSRWVPLFRQLSDLDEDLFAFITARRWGVHTPTGQNVLDDLLAATHDSPS